MANSRICDYVLNSVNQIFRQNKAGIISAPQYLGPQQEWLEISGMVQLGPYIRSLGSVSSLTLLYVASAGTEMSKMAFSLMCLMAPCGLCLQHSSLIFLHCCSGLQEPIYSCPSPLHFTCTTHNPSGGTAWFSPCCPNGCVIPHDPALCCPSSPTPHIHPI